MGHHDRTRPRPLRAVSHRLPAPGWRAHRPVQLHLRPPARRRLRAAHRRHRPVALHRRGDRPDPALAARDGARLGRGPREARPPRSLPADRAAARSIASTSTALLAAGHLYTCFHTPEQLEAERRAAQADKRAWVYSGACRDLSPDEVARRKAAGEPWTLRFRVRPGTTTFDDMLRGPVEVENDTIGDFIVQRSDGTITYNLAVVVDDVTMAITHVIRGDDHISNTPRQILIYEALGAPVAALSAHAAAVRHRSQEALQAPRRHQPRAAHRHGVPGRGGAQLPLLPVDRVRRVDGHLEPRRPRGPPRRREPGHERQHLRSREAALDERALHPRHGAGRSRAPACAPTSSGWASTVSRRPCGCWPRRATARSPRPSSSASSRRCRPATTRSV